MGTIRNRLQKRIDELYYIINESNSLTKKQLKMKLDLANRMLNNHHLSESIVGKVTKLVNEVRHSLNLSDEQ